MMCATKPLCGILPSLLLALVAGCSGEPPEAATGPKVFATPEAAASALFDAIDRDDKQAVVSIFGREYESRLVTADWAANREERQRIAVAGHEKLVLDDQDGVVTLVLGDEDWPFPIPLEREGEGWRFDTEEGLERVIDRRVGRNELSAIAIANAYVDAQIEYARADRDGDEVREYAQRLASTDGNRDGLYWESGPDEEESPFGPLVEGAEAYLDTLQPGDPLRGYYFKILTRQGPNPPGGAYDYLINGNMIAGFALVAYPADYGNTGIMTFVVNHRGVVRQKDIGPFTGMDAYNPDDAWTVAEAEEG
jgi:hypothetical protein